jgi:hypothetical protein
MKKRGHINYFLLAIFAVVLIATFIVNSESEGEVQFSNENGDPWTGRDLPSEIYEYPCGISSEVDLFGYVFRSVDIPIEGEYVRSNENGQRDDQAACYFIFDLQSAIAEIEAIARCEKDLANHHCAWDPPDGDCERTNTLIIEECVVTWVNTQYTEGSRNGVVYGEGGEVSCVLDIEMEAYGTGTISCVGEYCEPLEKI